jgi:hypothetical protein
MAGVAMSDHPPVRADLAGITWPMRLALAAMAGGPMTWLNGFYTDVAGRTHDVKVMQALQRRNLATPAGGRRSTQASTLTFSLTERGRWFAATALCEMADVLIMATMRDGIDAAPGIAPEAEDVVATGTEG